MARRSSKRYSKKAEFNHNFSLGVSFLDSAISLGTDTGKSIPVVDTIFHGLERIAAALIFMETGRVRGGHPGIRFEFERHFNEEFGEELMSFYLEINERKNELLYDFGDIPTKTELTKYLASTKKFKERAKGLALHRGWL
jgi:hypothetical protein